MQGNNQRQRYDYTTAGFNGFLTRSIGGGQPLTLTEADQQAATTRSISFDRSQITGALGDTLQIGQISLNGAEENIILSDGDNNRLLLGRQDGGF